MSEKSANPPPPAPAKALTYASYLRVDELLALQTPKSDPPEHDETLFIIIHQVYELWFKQLLHEFDKVQRDFLKADLYGAMATFKRCRTIMKTLVAQLDILETMTPMEFGSFRDRLESASGFQSAQFRALEFQLGYKRPAMLQHFPAESAAHALLKRRLEAHSVVDSFYEFLAHLGHPAPCAVLDKDVTAKTQPNEQVQETLLELYAKRPDVAGLLELLFDFVEGLQEWRYRHVKMVERTIGMKPGTGGSSGAEFLRQTLFRSVFPDLWAIRHRM